MLDTIIVIACIAAVGGFVGGILSKNFVSKEIALLKAKIATLEAKAESKAVAVEKAL